MVDHETKPLVVSGGNDFLEEYSLYHGNSHGLSPVFAGKVYSSGNQ